MATTVVLAPALAGIWVSRCFLTQDGPAHLYNAEILARSLDPGSPYRDAFAVQWQPLPNWAGHVLFLGLRATLPPWAAERAALTLTLLALTVATAWLRDRVVGGRAPFTTAALAVLIGLNVTWLFGFTSFLLGAALFPTTLGVWWAGRDRLTWRRALAIAALVVVGYFCHPVSLGLTAIGLVVLALVTPGDDRRNRLTLTFLALAPLVPLGLIYRSLTTAGGGMAPEWVELSDIFSLSCWKAQFGWVDPISLSAKAYRPFGHTPSPWNGLAAPLIWLALALLCLGLATIGDGARDRLLRGWGILAAMFILGGIVSPDTLGVKHGHYLPQRIILLGLVAIVPWLRLDAPGYLGRLGRSALLVALALQTLFVWDYGRECTATTARFLEVASIVGRNQREATVLIDVRGRFRPNSLLHADCLMGVGTGNVIWGNYETNYYYFPVQLRDRESSPPAEEIEQLVRLFGPSHAAERARIWSDILGRYGPSIDVVVMYGSDPDIESLTARRYRREHLSADGKVQVWRRAKPDP
jgi:hypothetical protein